MDPNSLRVQLMNNHKMLLEQLESKYMHYIQRLLSQKSIILMEIEDKFHKQLNQLNKIVSTTKNQNDNSIINHSLTHQNNPPSISSTKLSDTKDIIPSLEDVKPHTAANPTETNLNAYDDNNVKVKHELKRISFWNKGCKINKSQQIIKKNQNDNKTHKCSYCNFSSNAPSRIIEHERVHSGEKPFKCVFNGCNKHFKSKGSLKQHIRIHTGEKPFKCSYQGCMKAFGRSHQLKRHQRKHTGERYKCQYDGCTKTFASKTGLKYHTNSIHNTIKTYQCNICNKTFSDNNSCTTHIKGHQNNNNLPSST